MMKDEASMKNRKGKTHPILICVVNAPAGTSSLSDAILAGLKRRHGKTGDVPYFVHTVRTVSLAESFLISMS